MSLNLFFRLEYVDFLIRSKSTGKPKEFAQKLGVSERALYDLIHLMKDLGAPIIYSKGRSTYYYAEDGNLKVRFQKDKSSRSSPPLPTNPMNNVIILCLFFFDLFIEGDLILGVI